MAGEATCKPVRVSSWQIPAPESSKRARGSGRRDRPVGEMGGATAFHRMAPAPCGFAMA